MTYKEARNILLLRSCSDCKHFDMDTADCDWGIFEECTEAYYTAIQALQEPERRKGQWTTELKEDSDSLLRCSVCGYPVSYFGGRTNFCPSCGADMRGKEE